MTSEEMVLEPTIVYDPVDLDGDLAIAESRIPVKILIVDDNQDNLDVMETILENEPYQIVTALSGRDALKLILKYDFALIFMDVRMPIMDGLETARIIRERRKSAHVPIMFLTAYAREDARQIIQGYSLGAVDYLVKPVAPEILRSKAAAFVELYRKNEILRIQKQMLRTSRDELERRVKERTAELAKTNDELGLANSELNVVLKALEAQKKMITNIVTNVPGVVWEGWGTPNTDAQCVDFVSDFAQSFLGYSIEDWLIIPNFWLKIVHPEDRKTTADMMVEAYRNKKSGTSRFRWMTKDGKEIWVEAHYAVILDDFGEPIGMSGVTMDITEQKAAEKQIRDSLKEKDLLLKEIHHRVKNNLQIVSSILSLQSNYIKEPHLLEIFHESQSRIKSIALVHELLYEQGHLAKIEFKDYLENLVENIFRTIRTDPNRIEYVVESDPALMELDSAIHCGLIVNELLTNSIKYAFPDGRKGKISVSLKVENNICILTIEDDGIGLPIDLDVKTATSMGLQLVDTLIHQIGATLEIRRDAGACFIFKFPYPRLKGEVS
ncbi:histidine kinase dimerization/phosphoacceptor domain -containing protein [Leptospira alstonii]|uniref:histidine kinase n=2 Tax=Leptospira alstonii TaxID=28452 RepID=M6D4F9_9LEPT|nr:histidine kinase dimerization/phosphoacceptor domain -containing protein [Leptospira alstonii]EMJ96113.1 PAS domain S-box protein [Leptospira alstonii serovar Sichuan str. 79601]EQA79897.1 PAS domain S-box protein [Leptospira alstonii serovar Pingchang str. 80-412]